eukprot:TRINITY_DN11536_c0_g1_i6.p1 TRINITY_DN11536_c0_g1~~TRINITY_DN11536_c0_g1_i6.p1  ORF type:complete len:734 (+),score=68.52 TRINITY_DN11536_c0_g1_i6:123-2324(+)
MIVLDFLILSTLIANLGISTADCDGLASPLPLSDSCLCQRPFFGEDCDQIIVWNDSFKSGCNSRNDHSSINETSLTRRLSLRPIGNHECAIQALAGAEGTWTSEAFALNDGAQVSLSLSSRDSNTDALPSALRLCYLCSGPDFIPTQGVTYTKMSDRGFVHNFKMTAMIPACATRLRITFNLPSEGSSLLINWVAAIVKLPARMLWRDDFEQMVVSKNRTSSHWTLNTSSDNSPFAYARVQRRSRSDAVFAVTGFKNSVTWQSESIFTPAGCTPFVVAGFDDDKLIAGSDYSITIESRSSTGVSRIASVHGVDGDWDTRSCHDRCKEEPCLCPDAIAMATLADNVTDFALRVTFPPTPLLHIMMTFVAVYLPGSCFVNTTGTTVSDPAATSAQPLPCNATTCNMSTIATKATVPSTRSSSTTPVSTSSLRTEIFFSPDPDYLTTRLNRRPGSSTINETEVAQQVLEAVIEEASRLIGTSDGLKVIPLGDSLAFAVVTASSQQTRALNQTLQFRRFVINVQGIQLRGALPPWHPSDCVWKWSDWSPCNATCGNNAVAKRVIQIINPPQLNGRPCPRQTIDIKPCRIPACSNSTVAPNHQINHSRERTPRPAPTGTMPPDSIAARQDGSTAHHRSIGVVISVIMVALVLIGAALFLLLTYQRKFTPLAPPVDTIATQETQPDWSDSHITFDEEMLLPLAETPLEEPTSESAIKASTLIQLYAMEDSTQSKCRALI